MILWMPLTLYEWAFSGSPSRCDIVRISELFVRDKVLYESRPIIFKLINTSARKGWFDVAGSNGLNGALGMVWRCHADILRP